MKKSFIIVIILIVVAGAIYLITKPGNKKGLSFQCATVQKGEIEKVVTATGTIEPITQVEVGTQVSGTISKIYVDYNSEVKKGELLAELDRTVLEAELTSQSATLESNKIEYEYQTKNYLRIKGLHNKQLVSDSEMESAEYDYMRSKSAYEKSQSDLIKVRTNLSYATIYSPIDGVVLSRDVDEGQTVAASFNTPTLFTIANDLRKMQVIANVDEMDIGQVKDGQKVEFTVDAVQGEVFVGSVTQVRLQATTTSNVVTYEVVIDAPNPDLKLMPGLTANITIYTLSKEGVLVVPSRAFRFEEVYINGMGMAPSDDTPKVVAKAGEQVLWVEREGRYTPIAVRTGSSDEINSEIVSGLQEGERVVIGLQVGNATPSNSSNNNSGETNPFMPARPGHRRR